MGCFFQKKGFVGRVELIGIVFVCFFLMVNGFPRERGCGVFPCMTLFVFVVIFPKELWVVHCSVALSSCLRCCVWGAVFAADVLSELSKSFIFFFVLSTQLKTTLSCLTFFWSFQESRTSSPFTI